MFRLPEYINVNLTPENHSMIQPSIQGKIIRLNDVPQALRSELIPVK